MNKSTAVPIKNRKLANEIFWTRSRKRLLFYTLVMALPVTQVVIFYFWMNINSIILAFQQYNLSDNSMTFAGFENFKRVFTGDYGNALAEIGAGIRNSLLAYGIGLVASLCIGIPFSNAIYKKVPLNGLFKVLLFLPQVLSIVVMSIIYLYFMQEAVPAFMSIFGKQITGPMASSEVSVLFTAVMTFNVVTGFGSSMLLYTGAMSNISISMKEAAEIDGASAFQEFIHVTIPGIYPTMCTFIVVGIAGIFTNQINLFTFFGAGGPAQLSTLGYYIYKATLAANGSQNPYIQFPYLSAFGIVMTCIAVPVTLGMRKLLERVGPRSD